MLARINTALLTVILLVNAYIVTAPFLPHLWLMWRQHHTQSVTDLSQRIHSAVPRSPVQRIQRDNRLIIPSLTLDRPILEGTDTYAVLAKGVWRWPYGGMPDKGGNTVLVGHRFTYADPVGAFYFLDKLRAGDEIGVAWAGKTYRYIVVQTKVVPPSDTTIESPTITPTLTLYTCTPLWWPKDRLVVVARMEAMR